MFGHGKNKNRSSNLLKHSSVPMINLHNENNFGNIIRDERLNNARINK